MPTLREWLREAPFALTMSSGFFGFYAHAGLLTVLEDEGLPASRVSGSSAGALVAGAWAAGVDAPVLAGELERLTRRDFWDPGLGIGLLRGRLFRERLTRLVPGTFDDCRVPAALSVFEVASRRTHVVDRGEVAAAIHASCALPLLFHPVWIDGRAYLDGGILDRPGLVGMPKGERRVLFHHIESRSLRDHAPPRDGMVTFTIKDLPRPGPFRLEHGRRAFRVARDAARRALDRPIANGSVVVASG